MRAPEPQPFSRSVAWSAGGHALLFAAVWLLPRLGWISPPAFEIEIISPILGTGPAKLGAPKAFVPGVPALKNVTVPESKPAETPVTPPEAPKDWTLPGPSTKALETPAPPQTTPGGEVGGTGTAAKTGGSGEGSDEGVPGGTGDGGTPLSAMPRLLNRDEIVRLMKRFYPEAERRMGREGDVVVAIHIGASGSVSSVDVLRGATPAFDDAARKVAGLMRFSPAIGLNGRPVAVKLPQQVQFRLTD
ncbi:MAG: TonB family protein [Elusimicrobiota bacterium]|nr:TonB family protein [Elusimicrobiota bacterium]